MDRRKIPDMIDFNVTKIAKRQLIAIELAVIKLAYL